MKKGKLILGSGQKTQKRGFLPLRFAAPVALNMLGNMGRLAAPPQWITATTTVTTAEEEGIKIKKHQSLYHIN